MDAKWWAIGTLVVLIFLLLAGTVQPGAVSQTLLTTSGELVETIAHASARAAAVVAAFTVQPPPSTPTLPLPARQAAEPRPALRAWADTMGPRFPAVTSALDALLQQNERVVRQPALFDDPDWRRATLVALAAMWQEGNAVLESSGDVPAECELAYQALVESAVDLVAIAEDYRLALETRQPRPMSNAVVRLAHAMARVERANREWAQVRRQYGL